MVQEGFGNDEAVFHKLNATPLRSTVETAFWGNNVEEMASIADLYARAMAAPGTIVLDGMDVYRPEDQGLPADARVLLFNDGEVTARCAAARRIVGHPDVPVAELCGLVREAVFAARDKKMLAATALVGLDSDFTIKARLMIPENYANNLYSWALNFRFFDEEAAADYRMSRPMNDEGEILVFADPDWHHPDFPVGLALFSPRQNCAAILGMRYFGELKKGTLTLAWGTGARHGYACCHGGLKRYTRDDGENYVLAVFGLSGSGKSTITHARHGDKYHVSVLHDDALVVNVKERYAIAMEPSYFDKMHDYPTDHPANRYLLTLQNCGAAKGSDGKVRVVAEDIRNGNGRAIKSRFWTPNRVNRIDEPLNAIGWIMKDSTLPPLLRISQASMAAAMGATLATKRSSAERLLPGVDPDALVIESYANPFRTWSLGADYYLFKELFEDGVECFVLNTGDFMGKKVTVDTTLSAIERLVDGTARFENFMGLPWLDYLPIEGYELPRTPEYRSAVRSRMEDRLRFILSKETEQGGINRIHDSAADSIKVILVALRS